MNFDLKDRKPTGPGSPLSPILLGGLVSLAEGMVMMHRRVVIQVTSREHDSVFRLGYSPPPLRQCVGGCGRNERQDQREEFAEKQVAHHEPR